MALYAVVDARRDRCGVRLIGLSLLAAMLLWVSSPGEAQANLIANPGFELAGESVPPPGWVVFSGADRIFVERTGAYAGEKVLVFRDDADNVSVGLRSAPLPARAGELYEARVYVYNEPGSRTSLYLDFRDERNRRIEAKWVASSYHGVWEELAVSLRAPEGTENVSIILYSTPSNVGVSRWDEASLVLRARAEGTGSELELPLSDESLSYTPGEGSVVTTNPPSFIWVPVPGAASYILEYGSDPAFAPSATVRVDGIDLSIYTPPFPFDTEKTWYWRVYAVNSEGAVLPPTAARSFRIHPEAALFPLPDLEQMRSQVPATHPRLFVTQQTLPQWKARSNEEPLLRLLWSEVRSKALTEAFAPLPSEPPDPRAGGVFNEAVWRHANSLMAAATSRMELLALAYLLSGDPALAEAAKRHILNIASWDPNGATSASSNWDSAHPVLLRLARAYTWAYDALTAEERARVREAVRTRAEQFYAMLKRLPYESKPYASHATASLSALGEAALALLNEVPEAGEWFDYTVRIYTAVFPPWGGDAGGWAEGHAYWSSSLSRHYWFADALKVVTGFDLYQKPFFRNTGFFKLMTQPPYSKMGPFGDFADVGPNANAAASMSHLAAVFDDPRFQWYANQVSSSVYIQTGLEGYIRAVLYPRADYKGAAPVDAPTGAYFPDIGWVVFHRDYLAPEDRRIQFMFKSSPYGSFSHSLADQNSFTLEAYGEPLAISSGYRPWYGSPHHMGWTKTTQAHNSILVNGQGQKVQSLAAKGKILRYLNGESFSYTAGDAREAYGPPLLDRFVRHVVYVRPDLFVLFDDLGAPAKSTFSWLFHAYHPMHVDPAGHGFYLKAPKARLDVHLWSSEELVYNQTNEFAVPLDLPMDKPEQWHLTATTAEPATEAYFLAVLRPLTAEQQNTVEVQPVTTPSGVGLRMHDSGWNAVVLFRQGSGVIEDGELVADGDAAGWIVHATGEQGVLLVNGRMWRTQTGLTLEAAAPISAEFTERDGMLTGSIHLGAEPQATPVEVIINVNGRSVVDVTSSHRLAWRREGQGVRLTLQPGEHQLQIVYGD